MDQRVVIYVGALSLGKTSLYRMKALERQGIDVIPFDIERYVPRNKLGVYLWARNPGTFMTHRLNADLQQLVKTHRPNVIWCDKPTHISAGTMKLARRHGAVTISYIQDNPFGPRQDGVWRQYFRIFKDFDLHCAFRHADEIRFKERGLQYIRTVFAYDPQQHFPPPPSWGDAHRTRDVAYTGSPYEERPAFLSRLAETGSFKVAIAGPRWNKVWTKEKLKEFGVGGMMKGEDYRHAIWTSKINLAFVTHANEDDIAHKAIEIAACGQFLLAERTPGHVSCFEEDKEAVFFSDVKECAGKVKYYLDNAQERNRIAEAGRARITSSGYSNDVQLGRIMSAANRIASWANS